MSEEQPKGLKMELIGVALDRYGPYAFGLVATWLLWSVIAQPEIERAKLSLDENRLICAEMRAIAVKLETVTHDLERLVRHASASTPSSSSVSSSVSPQQ